MTNKKPSENQQKTDGRTKKMSEAQKQAAKRTGAKVNKFLTDNLAGDIYKDKRVRKFASKVKEGLKNSPLNLKRGAEGYINFGKKVIQKVKDRTKKAKGGLALRGYGRAYKKGNR